MTETDKKFRVAFCAKFYQHKLGAKFWTSGIRFYFDGTGLVYKKNPLDQELAPEAGEQRMRSEKINSGLYSKRKNVRNPTGPLHGGHSLWDRVQYAFEQNLMQ